MKHIQVGEGDIFDVGSKLICRIP